jgi:hypothetical protein
VIYGSFQMEFTCELSFSRQRQCTLPSRTKESVVKCSYSCHESVINKESVSNYSQLRSPLDNYNQYNRTKCQLIFETRREQQHNSRETFIDDSHGTYPLPKQQILCRSDIEWAIIVSAKSAIEMEWKATRTQTILESQDGIS